MTIIAKTFLKDPDGPGLNYGIDWGTWLPSGVTISSSSWILPSGITEESSSNTTTTTAIVLSGGTAGLDYELTNRVVLSNGLGDDRTIRIQVRDR